MKIYTKFLWNIHSSRINLLSRFHKSGKRVAYVHTHAQCNARIFFFVLCKKFLTSLYYVHKSSLRYACYTHTHTHTPSYHPVSQQKLLLFLTASWDSGLVNFKPESFFLRTVLIIMTTMHCIAIAHNSREPFYT